jgi:hypothetical protein
MGVTVNAEIEPLRCEMELKPTGSFDILTSEEMIAAKRAITARGNVA